MSNPWGVKLRKTGLNEQRSAFEQSSAADLEKNQMALKDIASENASKIGEYKDRQGSLAADALAGQQGRMPGQNLGGRRKSRRHRKSSRRHRKHRKTRRHRRRH
jgi:hypothetical protein